jgi:hypothetical protein
MNQQHYRVGEKTFVNAYAALYESAQTEQFSQGIAPQYHLDAYSAVDVARLQQYTTADLIRQKLSVLRQSHNKIRLHYTGGRDSHTILLAALDMGIDFDCVFTHTNSIVEDLYTEQEFTPGIEFANSVHMPNVVHRLGIEDFERVWTDPWCFTKYHDFYHGFAPVYSDLMLDKYDDYDLELLGVDKPWYYVNGDDYYWILNDATDYCIGRTHEDFFLGSVHPELTVKQVYQGYEFIKQRDKQGFVVYKDLPQKHFCRHLGLHDGIDVKYNEEKTRKDFHATGYFNNKHYRSMQQVLGMGRQDIVDAWRETSAHLVEQLSPAPYGLETRTILDGVKSTTTVARITAIFKITPTNLEMLPHTDINRLTQA